MKKKKGVSLFQIILTWAILLGLLALLYGYIYYSNPAVFELFVVPVLIIVFIFLTISFFTSDKSSSVPGETIIFLHADKVIDAEEIDTKDMHDVIDAEVINIKDVPKTGTLYDSSCSDSSSPS